MPPPASEITLSLKPESRLDLIDVSSRVAELVRRYQKALYYSYHTTAGYLDPRLCARLNHDSDNLQAFLRSFQNLFPPGADYRHDAIEMRDELTAEQKKGEPKNGDAHLTYIGSGLNNCVTYANNPRVPVFFIDLDGVHGKTSRCRQTTVIGFDQEKIATELSLTIPVSGHPIDSVNLKSRQLGIFERLEECVHRYGIVRGRIDITLDRNERQAGLTVNEYETMLMKHDLVEILRDPLRFVAERGRHMISDPRSIAVKAKGYAKYDFVQILNEFIDALGLSESLIERIIHKFLAYPASRFLRMKRSISLPVNDRDESGRGLIVEGAYQSPILVQWSKAQPQIRRLRAQIVSFE